MKSLPRITRHLLALVATAALCSAAFAEVSVDSPTHDGAHSIHMFLGGSAGDDPVPWPWDVFRTDAPADWILNPNGSANGDGRPSITVDPATGYPEVAWAWNDGNDFEIVVSRVDGLAWTTPELVTDNNFDDVDPNISVGALGRRHVSWWRMGESNQVWYAALPAPGSSWEPEELVLSLDQRGVLPDVTHVGDSARVAYQSLTNQGGVTQVRVAERQSGGQWISSLIGESILPPGDVGETSEVFAEVHYERGKLWVDWLYSDGTLAFSRYHPGSGWSAAQFETYRTSAAASGVEEFMLRWAGRRAIRLQVLAN